jgi:acyl carrier protein
MSRALECRLYNRKDSGGAKQMALFASYSNQRLDLIGEDTIGLLKTIQTSFGIRFSDDDVIEATTVGTLSDCVTKKLDSPPSRQCLSAVVFFRLRRTLVDFRTIPRANIAPKTSLHGILPWRGRAKRWRDLQERSGLVLPNLRWPGWLLALSMGAVLALNVLEWKRIVAVAAFGSPLLAVFESILVAALLLWTVSPLAREFPGSCQTVGDLAKLGLAYNHGKITSEYGVSSGSEVLMALRQMIAAEESIDIEKITPDTRFPEDLKIY